MRVAASLAIVLTLAAVSPAHAELTLSMHDGRVSISARDVTVRQILAEWARVGQTTIVNAEGMVGGPITLQLTDVPERQALDILLRSATGYLAAPRAAAVPTASRFNPIVIMPTSAPARTTAAPPPLAQRFPTPNDQDDDGDAPRNGPPPAPPLAQQLQQAQQQLQRGQQVTTFPPAVIQGEPSGTPPAPFATPVPSAPTGVAAPGMLVPTPQVGQPGQVGTPQSR